MPAWRKYHEEMIPKFPKEVKAEIKILEKMELREDSEYTTVDGKKIHVTMFRYPEGAVTKFTQFHGDKRFVKQGVAGNPEPVEVLVDDRKYRTPNEGSKPNCFVNYQVISPEGERYGTSCLPSEFAKLIGWKADDGKVPFSMMPDTTPTNLPPQYQVELERLRIESEKEMAVEKAKEKAKGKASGKSE